MRDNMRTWAELTPQQRQAAREQYKAMKQLPPEQEAGSPPALGGILQPAAGKETRACREGAARRARAELARKKARGGAAPAVPANPPPGAAPQSHRRGERCVSRDAPAPPAPPHLPLSNASLARRLASLAYETMILGALLLVAGFVTLPLVPPAQDASALRVPDAPARALSLAVVFGAGAVYCVASWSGGRRTLPMKTWRIALVRRDGARCRSPRSHSRATCPHGSARRWRSPATSRCARFGAGALALPLVAFNFLWAVADRGPPVPARPHRRHATRRSGVNARRQASGAR